MSRVDRHARIEGGDRLGARARSLHGDRTSIAEASGESRGLAVCQEAEWMRGSDSSKAFVVHASFFCALVGGIFAGLAAGGVPVRPDGDAA